MDLTRFYFSTFQASVLQTLFKSLSSCEICCYSIPNFTEENLWLREARENINTFFLRGMESEIYKTTLRSPR